MSTAALGPLGRLRSRLAAEPGLIVAFSGGVRAHAGGTLARIELPGDQIAAAICQREAIDGQMRAAGFTFSAIDLAGFRSGSMNSLLQIRPAGGGS